MTDDQSATVASTKKLSHQLLQNESLCMTQFFELLNVHIFRKTQVFVLSVNNPTISECQQLVDV